jgi:gamma-glutamylcyclotransferase (GGCT)/AIG2-like uncharacterized protein YtfP
MINKVFVYGTLCEGEANHHVVAPFVKKVTEAKMKGWLYHLPYGYPAMVEGTGEVIGQFIELSNVEEAIKHMDELEGYEEGGSDNDYERIISKAVTQDGQEHGCYVYIYSESKKTWLEEQAEFVVDGDWRAHQRKQSWIPYFAYGSCMNRSSFSEDVPVFRVVGRAILNDYRIGFTRYSAIKWGGGVADIVPEQGRKTEGVLYVIPPELLLALDKREGVNSGAYRREKVQVEIDDMRIEALTYMVVEKQVDMAPSQKYKEVILEGSDLLSVEYVQELKNFMESL